MLDGEFAQALAHKAHAAVGALIGVGSLAMVWIPPAFRDKSKLAAGVLIGGGSVGVSFVGAAKLMDVLGYDVSNSDNWLFVGALIGVCFLPLSNSLGNFLKVREKDPIDKLIKDVKNLGGDDEQQS